MKPFPFRFTPAITYSVYRNFLNLDIPYIADERWQGTDIYHPDILLSYHYWFKAKAFPSRTNAYVFGDSGGYSIRTKGAVIDPVGVIRWQLKFCDVGAILDIPQMDQLGTRIWERALTPTLGNMRRALPIYLRARGEGHPFRWWGVMHGEPGEEMEHWWQKLVDIYPFRDEGEGWAFRAETARDPTTKFGVAVSRAVALVFKFAEQHKMRRVHLLAATSPEATAAAFALAQLAGVEFLSFDSASAFIGAANRQVYIATKDGLSWTHLKEKSQWEPPKPDHIPLTAFIGEPGPKGPSAKEIAERRERSRRHIWECECAACVRIRGEEKSFETVTDGRWNCWFMLHNLGVQSRVFAAQGAAAAENPDAMLRTIIGENEYARTMRAFAHDTAIVVERSTPHSLLEFLE